jgi:cell division septal protein FtsQ
MAKSRATTPAGRRRAARRGATAAGTRTRRQRAAHGPRKAKPKRTKPKARRAPPKPRKPPVKRSAGGLRSRGPRILVTLLIILGVLAATYQLWFRNSSFVAVERVTIEGVHGSEQEAVESALSQAAGDMTTLNVDEDALEAAVAGFPTVVGVDADADFPHDLALLVKERPPVLLATAGGESLPVAGDGTVLPGVDVSDLKIPSIGVDELPEQGRLSGDALQIARVMGPAPKPLLELVEEISVGGEEGVQVTLRGGVPVWFGGSDDATAKWDATAAILADPQIDTLTYVDVRVAERPSIGGAAPAVTESTTDTTAPETAAPEPVAP